MPKSRPPEDRLPSDAPCFLEVGAIRFELPVRWQGATGTLVIRLYDELVVPKNATPYDTEASVRVRLVLLLDAERRNQR